VTGVVPIVGSRVGVVASGITFLPAMN